MLCEHPAAALRILGHDQVGARESQRLLLDLTFKSSPLVFASLRFKAVKIFSYLLARLSQTVKVTLLEALWRRRGKIVNEVICRKACGERKGHNYLPSHLRADQEP